MKISDKLINVRQQIINAAIGFTMTWILAELVKWVRTVMPKIGESVLRNYLNHVCRVAAQINHNALIILLTIMLIGAVCAGVCGLAGMVFKKAKGESVDIQDDNSEIIGEGQEKSKSDNGCKTNILKAQRKTKLMTIVLVLLVIFMVYLLFTDYILPLELLNQFEMEIKAIAPYVDELDVQRLESQWVLMDDCYDYNEIQQFIQSVKEANNLAK